MRGFAGFAVVLLAGALALGHADAVFAKDFRVRSHLVSGVPYVAQSSPRTCGAAALAMLLSYWAEPTTEADILRLHPEIAERGTWMPLLWQVPREKGFEVEYGEGNYERVKELLRSNRPVIVFQFAQTSVERPHLRVVVGYDDVGEVFIVNDPGAPEGEAMRIGYREFVKLWVIPWLTADDGSEMRRLYVAVSGRAQAQ